MLFLGKSSFEEFRHGEGNWPVPILWQDPVSFCMALKMPNKPSKPFSKLRSPPKCGSDVRNVTIGPMSAISLCSSKANGELFRALSAMDRDQRPNGSAIVINSGPTAQFIARWAGVADTDTGKRPLPLPLLFGGLV